MLSKRLPPSMKAQVCCLCIRRIACFFSLSLLLSHCHFFCVCMRKLTVFIINIFYICLERAKRRLIPNVISFFSFNNFCNLPFQCYHVYWASQGAMPKDIHRQQEWLLEPIALKNQTMTLKAPKPFLTEHPFQVTVIKNPIRHHQGCQRPANSLLQHFAPI